MPYFVVVDRDRETGQLRFGGLVDRDVAHSPRGVPHATVLILPIRKSDRGVEVLIHRRSPDKRVSPNCWDIAGGHAELEFADVANAEVRQSEFFEHCYDETAAREASEELVVVGRGASREVGAPALLLERFGRYGEFECDRQTPDTRNVEFSTLYLAALPEQREIVVRDSVVEAGCEVHQSIADIRYATLAELLGEFAINERRFADGLGRVLARLLNDGSFRATFERALEELFSPA